MSPVLNLQEARAAAVSALPEAGGHARSGYKPHCLKEMDRIHLGMNVYLDCDTCVALWAEYGAATTRIRTAATPTWEATEARLRAASEAVLAHGAEAHKTSADSSD
jgi:hypothetical protein